jgi:TolA-binding protein
MKKLALPLVLFMLLAVAACSADKGKQQLETARFEEQQNNREHAVKLYEEIISKYPDSANAKIARERLAALKGGK